MKKILAAVLPCFFSTATISFFSFSAAFGQIPAFPGAEGFGSKTPGGRGGTIIEVTNLTERGPGSFRAACEASGPRIVMFRTGGTIHSFGKRPYPTISPGASNNCEYAVKCEKVSVDI